MKLSVRNMTRSKRSERVEDLCATLRNSGLEVDDNHRLVMGTFNAAAGRFIDTTPKVFLRAFLTAAVIKGHFMGNKGYLLSQLPKRPQVGLDRNKVFAGRSIPLGLRYRILEKEGCCRSCGRRPRDGVILHVDHIIPVSQGGRTELANLQVLCSECNIGKGNRSCRRMPLVR
jgi:hypothetical protein